MLEDIVLVTVLVLEGNTTVELVDVLIIRIIIVRNTNIQLKDTSLRQYRIIN